jgi:hypothetical protein
VELSILGKLVGHKATVVTGTAEKTSAADATVPTADSNTKSDQKSSLSKLSETSEISNFDDYLGNATTKYVWDVSVSAGDTVDFVIEWNVNRLVHYDRKEGPPPNPNVNSNTNGAGGGDNGGSNNGSSTTGPGTFAPGQRGSAGTINNVSSNAGGVS